MLLHVQGGGWCLSPADCAERAQPGWGPYAGQPSLGSSLEWAESGCDASDGVGGAPAAGPLPAPVCVADGGDHGFISADPLINPQFANWTKLFLGYCSGDSFAGAAEEAIVVNATSQFYFRGRYILDAVVETALASHGLASAPAVIIAGCSAGGMAVFFQANRLRTRIAAVNPAATIVAVPGAGAILYAPSLAGAYLLDPGLQWLWATANMSGSAPPACLAAQAADPHMCFYPQTSLAHADADAAPLFVSNSLADLAQASAVMGLGCDPTARGACSPAQLAYLNAFRVRMLAALAPVLAADDGGAWLPECFVHVLQNDDYEWAGVTVTGQTQRDTMRAWWVARAGGTPPVGMLAKVVDGGWTVNGTSNPTCPTASAARHASAALLP